MQTISVTDNLVPKEAYPTLFKKLCKIYVFIADIAQVVVFFVSYTVYHFSIRLNQVQSP